MRPDLRVIISSATLEARALGAYFDSRTTRRAPEARGPGDGARKPALISVEGRTVDVQVRSRAQLAVTTPALFVCVAYLYG